LGKAAIIYGYPVLLEQKKGDPIQNQSFIHYQDGVIGEAQKTSGGHGVIQHNIEI